MSFFKRHPQLDEEDSDTDNVDPNLRLRTALTAHSTSAESIRSELRQRRRENSLKKFTFGKRPGSADLTGQSVTTQKDKDMYYPPLVTARVPKAWNLSDKTGTLSRNIMEFAHCSIGGVRYGEGIPQATNGAAKRRSSKNSALALSDDEERERLAGLKAEMVAIMERSFKNRWFRRDKLTMISPAMARDLATQGDQRKRVIGFFKALAICHTVLPDLRESGLSMLPADGPRLEYKAESPEEAALVAGAREAGFPFLARSSTTVDIEALGTPERYVLLKVLEFSLTRKRMSVIVRDPQGHIVLYCKGTESVIYERLAAGQDTLRERTREDMEAFADEGLRTLCIASRSLSEEEYLTWSVKYDAAAAAVRDQDGSIDKANELIEHSLLILGATALKNKLQEGVLDAIEQLQRAGMTLWILTGHKLYAAIEIGYSCDFLKSEMEVMVFSATTADATRTQIEAGLNKIASVLGPPYMNKGRPRTGTVGQVTGFAAVIDEDTLRFALDDSLRPLFLSLGTQCDTAICCCDSAQKALIVRLVQGGKKAMTLSISDGANDVTMIQEAEPQGLFSRFWSYITNSDASTSQEGRTMASVSSQRGSSEALSESVVVDQTTISREMSLAEILGHLSHHGCVDVTGQLDVSRITEYPISSGGFGDVYKAALHNGSQVALKCLRLHLDSRDIGKRQLKRAAHELYVWSKCKHPNVLELVGVTQHRNQIAMVSPWMDYGNLRRFLSLHPEADRYILCLQIADGVVYLHSEGIVHGDLKGDNVMVSADFIPKLADFGNAALKRYTLGFSQTTSKAGTSLRWTPHEVLDEETGLTVEADVYSLGMTMLEVVTGEVPYAGMRDSVVMAKVLQKLHPVRPKEISPQNEAANLLWVLLTRCWAYSPQDRPLSLEVYENMKDVVRRKIE